MGITTKYLEDVKRAMLTIGIDITLTEVHSTILFHERMKTTGDSFSIKDAIDIHYELKDYGWGELAFKESK